MLAESLVGCSPWGRWSRTWLSDFTFTFHFHALEEMATHSSVLAWRIPGTGETGGLQSMRLHRVRHDWSDLATAAADLLGIHYLCCLFGMGISILCLSYHSLYLGNTQFVWFQRFTAGEEFCLTINRNLRLTHTWFRQAFEFGINEGMSKGIWSYWERENLLIVCMPERHEFCRMD